MTFSERIIWLLAILFFAYLWFSASQDSAYLEKLLIDQNVQLNQQNVLLDSIATEMLTKAIDATFDQQPAQISLPSWFVRDLQEKGLVNPEIDIINDLFDKHELIPIPGIHGGTMRIFSIENIQLLNYKWAYTTFEDGHIMGAMLLEYSVDNTGSIQWDVIRYTVY